MDLVAVEAVGLAGVLDIAPAVLGGSDYLEKKGVFFARASEIGVESEAGSLEFTVDEEVIGDEPAEFTVVPRTPRMIVGPGYAPEPEE